ncbi:serine/threonine-protein kinase Nek1-like [Acropora millepora]|uniref:serine/threonine-protein kinase Nek1-like n=1 Tax=Acropora millepora TaxID=45264 RepID=UPI001CF5D74A|nr:serine/threonine-protein kinase Nek1-like [Acropora millepora]
MERYVRVKKIGEGSFGKALLVKKKADGKQYVIKEIGISKMSPKERQESRREVKVLSQLKHPNIVSYQESFEENGNLYIVMDYCEAGDLYMRINSQRGIQMQEEQVLDYFVQICLGLKHVHDRKILHRDLKSQNIFLTKSGVVKLGDFGIARVLHSTVELARTAIGTPYYLSPEICENRPYNNKSDMWSLGCVLYELLTLKHAFEAGNMKNLILKIIRGSYPPIPYKYSADIRGLVAQLLKRNARDRPSINSVLKKPFIQKRIEKFLTQDVMADEFSHTVIHRKPLGVIGQQRMLPAKPVKQVHAPQRYSDPKAKYGVSVAKKRPAPAKKPSSGDAANKPSSRPSSGGHEKPAADRKKEPDARERRRKEMMQNQEQMYQDYLKKVQQQRWERQQKEKKQADPSVGAKPNQQEIFKKEPHPMQKYQAKEPKENKPARPVSAVVRNKQPDVKAAGRPVSANDANRAPPAAQPANLALDAAKQGAMERAQAAGAAERARILEEFWLRKKEAQRNRVRGHNFNALPDHFPPANGPQQKDVTRKDAQEKDYLARLEAIRRQNFQERKELQRRMAGVRAPVAPAVQKENVLIPGDPRFDPEARKKKIADLKAQAEERAAMLRAQLEERKKAILQRINKEGKDKLEKENLKKDPDKRPLPALANYQRPAEPVAATPAVAPVGLETALKQVGATQLFRSNSEGDIRKMTEEDKSEPLAPPRKAWDNIPFQPRILPLEVTASAMEATSNEDAVLKPGNEAAAHRKQWGKPHVTQIISALGNAKLQTATTTIGPDEPDAPKKARLPVVTQSSGNGHGSAMGATVTVQKPSTPSHLGATVVKSPTADSPKTIIARRDKIDENKEGDDGVEGQATITVSGNADEDTKKPVVGMETILEGTNEGEKETKTINSDESGNISLEEVETITDHKEEPKAEEKPAPKSPVKAWGEVKASPPIENSAAEECSPPVNSSLSASRAAYQEFLNDTRKKHEEKNSKEVLFERVEQKENKEKRTSEELEIQDLSFDEVSFHTADGSPNKSMRAAELQTGIYDTNFTRLKTCSLPDLRMLFEAAAATGHVESLEAQLVKDEKDAEEDGDEEDADSDDGDDDELDEVDAEEIVTIEDDGDDEEEEEELNFESEEEESEEFEDMLNSMRDVLVRTGRSPSPTKGMRDSARSLDWDHCADTKAGQEEEDKDAVAFERSSSELSNLNEDWDSGDDDDDEENVAKKAEREKKRQEEDESLFQRLEESRLMLEQELGFDKFLRVYRYLQIELGVSNKDGGRSEACKDRRCKREKKIGHEGSSTEGATDRLCLFQPLQRLRTRNSRTNQTLVWYAFKGA